MEKFELDIFKPCEFTRAEPFRQYLLANRSKIAGQPLRSLRTVGSWLDKKLGCFDDDRELMLNAPAVLCFETIRLDFMLLSRSRARLCFDRDMALGMLPNASRFFPNIVGRAVVDLCLTEYDTGFFDGPSAGVDGFSKLSLIMDSGFELSISAEYGRMFLKEQLLRNGRL